MRTPDRSEVTNNDRSSDVRMRATLTRGQRVGGFVVVEEIGVGGMAHVYRARDEALSRDVALKVLSPEVRDHEAKARFLREARALARVSHDNVVRVWSSGEDGDIAWMSLALVEGRSLDDVLQAGPLDVSGAVLLAAEIARGLSAVHAQGVIHRDVKPSNLLLDGDGGIHIADFGIAQFTDAASNSGYKTREGVAVGTPHFMAPEQARGGEIDEAADAWGLGATLFMMLTGRPPFFVGDDDADMDILARVLRDRAPDVRTLRSGVPASVAAITASLLDPSARTRLRDLADVSERLYEVAEGLSLSDDDDVADDDDENGAQHDAPHDDAPHDDAARDDEADDEGRRENGREASRSRQVPRPDPRVPSPPSKRTIAVPNSADLSSSPRFVPFMIAGVFLLVGGGLLGMAASSSFKTTRDQVDEVPPTEVEVVGPTSDDPLRIGTPPSTVVGDTVAVDESVAHQARLTELESEIVDESASDKAKAKAARLLLADDHAAEVVIRLAGDPRAASTMHAVIVADNARAHIGAVLQSAASPIPSVARVGISSIEALRPIEALDVLSRVSVEHPDASIRESADRARRALFSVEGDPD